MTPLPAERPLTRLLHAKEPLERVDARSCPPPFVGTVPWEVRADGLGHPPAVREAELGQHDPGRREAEAVHEVFPKDAHRDRVDQERALSREVDPSALRIDLQQLLQVEIVGAHVDQIPSAGLVRSPTGRLARTLAI